jgi:amidophosphoribosyltransferase
VIGADSVRYLSIPGLVGAVGIRQDGLCLGCLNARYPVEVPEERVRFQKSLEEF